MSLQVIDGGRLKEYMMIPGGNICPLLAVRGFRYSQPTYGLSLTGNFVSFLSWCNAEELQNYVFDINVGTSLCDVGL